MKKLAILGLFLGLVGLVHQNFGAEESRRARGIRERAAKPLTLQQTWERIVDALDRTETFDEIVKIDQLRYEDIIQDLYALDQDILTLNNGLLTNLFTQLKESIKKPDTKHAQALFVDQLKKQLRKFKNYVTSLAIQESDMGKLLPTELAKLIAEFGT